MFDRAPFRAPGGAGGVDDVRERILGAGQRGRIERPAVVLQFELEEDELAAVQACR